METAIAYIRVSDPKQVVDGNSLVTQEIQVRHLAESRGYYFDRLFAEPGESAKTDHRPVLQEMLRYCVQNRARINVLIVPRIDRLARNTFDYASLKVKLNRIGIRLESVGERIEDSPVGRFTETILASVAQFDNEVRAERSRNGMVQAVREGRWVFEAPYGYRNIRFNGKATIEPEPDEAATVRRIFLELAAGAHPNELHQRLTRQGIRFTRSHFFKIIRSEKYLGVIRAFGETIQAAPPFLPLVSQTEFSAAQAAISRKTWPRTYDRDNPDFPLRGTLKCACGQFMTASWSSGRSKRYSHYRCLHCPRINIATSLAHKRFVMTLNSLSLKPSVAERLGRCLAAKMVDWNADVEIERETARKEIVRIEELRAAIARKNALEVIPDDLAKQQLGELEAELRLLRERMARQIPTTEQLDSAIRFAVAFVSNLGSFWIKGDTKLQKHLQRYLFADGIDFAALGQIRTAKNDRLAGTTSTRGPEMSSVVPHRFEIPSLFRLTNVRKMSAIELWESVVDLHQRFEVFK
ncbi:MAG: recombinase family protein [Fimbriimonadaceae bacterium]|nr:recombinase family protein [Fimbriimonadaceae bacterium]QYK58058.1 MAG: recombinase family protein [Fimbriimonadaceae bacterium]